MSGCTSFKCPNQARVVQPRWRRPRQHSKMRPALPAAKGLQLNASPAQKPSVTSTGSWTAQESPGERLAGLSSRSEALSVGTFPGAPATARGAMVAVDPPPPLVQQPALQQPARHCSLNSRVPTAVVFENATGRTVEVIWLSYQGSPHRYHTLQPSARTVQYTFTSHPWAFRDAADPGALLTVDGQAVFYVPQQQQGGPRPHAVIKEVERQPWEPAHHEHTPEAFRGQVHTLLLCHRRLETGGQASALLPPRQRGRDKLRDRLRSVVCRARERAQRRAGREQRRPQAAAAQTGLPTLGDLPQDLVLKIVAAAAPAVPVLALPALPHGVSPEELAAGALGQLFRLEAGGQGQASQHGAGGGGHPGVRAQLEAARRMPAGQLHALRDQHQNPRPPPLAAVAHPLLGQLVLG